MFEINRSAKLKKIRFDNNLIKSMNSDRAHTFKICVKFSSTLVIAIFLDSTTRGVVIPTKIKHVRNFLSLFYLLRTCRLLSLEFTIFAFL
jgi:hypothetical protein